MPNVTGITYKEANDILKEKGIEIKENVEMSNETIITDQLPKAGIQINQGTQVILYGS